MRKHPYDCEECEDLRAEVARLREDREHYVNLSRELTCERDEAREAARTMHEEVFRLQALLIDAQGIEQIINGVAYAAEIELPWLEENE